MLCMDILHFSRAERGRKIGFYIAVCSDAKTFIKVMSVLPSGARQKHCVISMPEYAMHVMLL